MTRTIRVMIVAEYDLRRSGLEAILSQSLLGIRVVASCRNLETGEQQIAQHHPHVLLLDDALPPIMSIFDRIRALRRTFPFLKIVVVSSQMNAHTIQQLFQAGAAGFVNREDRLAETLAVGVDTVYQGYRYTSPRASGLLASVRTGETRSTFSASELHALTLLEAGYVPQQIAYEMKLSRRQVYRIFAKLRDVLDVKTNEQLLVAAREQGMVSEGLPD